jgi:hypothetical protein
MPAARAASARVLPALTGTRRDARHTGTYSHDVSAGWIARHLLHDLAHHVLDIRCGYARLCLGWTPRRVERGAAGDSPVPYLGPPGGDCYTSVNRPHLGMSGRMSRGR